MNVQTHKAKLKIAIVDDHPLTRFAIRSLIEGRPDWEVCYECASPSELLEQIEQDLPEVVVIDLCFAEESGLDLLKKLSDAYPEMRTLVYSGNSELEYANQCFRLGASGYISKEEPVSNVQTAIEWVVKGYAYVSERLSQSVLDDDAAAAGPDAHGA